MAKDYYDMLGIPRNASGDAVKKAYRKLAMKYHPDRNPKNQEWANHKFKEINEAYGVLGDPQKRKQYDQFGTVGNAGDVFSSPFTRSTFEDLMKEFGGAGLNLGFLDQIFVDAIKGRGFSFQNYGRPSYAGRRGKAGAGAGINWGDIFGGVQKPRDVRYELSITPEEALRGTKKCLSRNGRRLEVKIPPGVKTGSLVRLRNACRVTEGHPGDIVVRIKIK